MNELVEERGISPLFRRRAVHPDQHAGQVAPDEVVDVDGHPHLPLGVLLRYAFRLDPSRPPEPQSDEPAQQHDGEWTS
jgi:hypothetical protein